MKAPNIKQRGFFDPVTGLALLTIFGFTGAAIESTIPANPANTIEAQHQVACVETDTAIVQEDFHCN
jgi:hypothetical protein